MVVHRLLAAAIGIAPLPDSVRDKDALHDCANNLNTRHRNAQMAGRASVELHTLVFFKDNSVVADARVVMVSRDDPWLMSACRSNRPCRSTMLNPGWLVSAQLHGNQMSLVHASCVTQYLKGV